MRKFFGMSIQSIGICLFTANLTYITVKLGRLIKEGVDINEPARSMKNLDEIFPDGYMPSGSRLLSIYVDDARSIWDAVFNPKKQSETKIQTTTVDSKSNVAK